METPSKSVGDVFAESWKAEEENLNSPEVQAARTLAENLNASSLPGLKRLYEETTDAPARAMMEFFLREKTTEMMQELGEIDGYENTLRWAAEKKRDNQIDDAFLEAAFEIIKEKARQPQPGVSLQDAEAFIKATPDVFDDLAKGLYGIIRYTPQAAFETAREIKIEELNRARKLLGMEPVKQPETPATKLLTYGALQGTYETGRLLQRLGRIVTLGVEDFDDESIRKRFKEDLDLIDTMVSFERGQTKAKDEKTGKPVQVVAEEDVEMISPIGEFASLDNAASLGAGVLAKNLTKAGAKTLSQRLVSAAPRLMTIAERRASQAAAEEAARQAVSLPRRALGTTVESVGTAAQKVAESPTARGAIAGGITLATGGSVPAAAMAAVGGGSSVGRQVVKNVPGAITRTGKAIKAPITGPIGKLTEVVGDIQRGMVAGTATMAPLALPAETVEERATLLAGGAVAGGFGAGADVARNSVRQFGRSMWTPSNQVVPESQRAKTTAYGTADLDAAHAAYVNQLPADSANRIEALRDLIGDKNELYVIDPATYDSLDQTQAGGAKSSGVVYATGQNGRRIALVRGGSESLMHEVGHVVFNSLPASSQKQLRDAVLDGYTTEQLEQMREYYTSRGIDLPDTDTLIEEVVAENFQVALNGSPLSQLGTPGNLAARIYNSVGILAERVGLRGIVPGTDVVTSQTLQFTPSFIAVNAINALRQAGQFDLAGTAGPVTPPGGPAAAAPTPPPVVSTAEGATVAPEAPPPVTEAPAAPAAPAVTLVSVTPAEPGQTTPRPARSIYATPKQREEITTQEATPEIEAANRQTLATELAKPRADRRPIQVGYNSAKADEARTDGPLKLNEPQRAEQRALADEGEASGVADQFREVYDKVTIPYKAQDTKKGGTTLFAFSLDKVIRNIDMLGAWLRRNPDAAASLAQTTGVQSLESPEFRAQFQNYLQNQANGYRGDGKPLVKTEDTRAEDIPDPTPGYTPVPVPKGASRLINSLMGLRNAIDYGEGATAAQSYVQRLAKANGAAVVEVREVPGRKAGEMVPTNEFNLVNKELRDLGFDTNLFHVAIEQLRLKRIATPIAFREDLNVRAPLQGVIQIGFMPAPAPNTPEFKRWFGDWEDPKAFTSRAKGPVSVVVDENSRPKVVYHGTGANFTEFKTKGTGVQSFGILGDFDVERTGVFFAEDPAVASSFADRPGGNVVPAYLSIKSPADLRTPDSTYDVLEEVGRRGRAALQAGFQTWELFDGKEGRQFVEDLKKAGYDGAMFSEYVPAAKKSTDVWVAFDPTQIKSATGNTGAFNPENPDIRFMPAPAPNTPEFKRWFGDSKVVDANEKPMVVYHGTRAGDFTEFRPSTALGWGTGIYFTDNRDQAANEYGFRGRVVEAFVSIKRPYTGNPISSDVLEKTKAWEKVKDDYRYPEDAWEEDSTFINEALRELGYDGVIVENSNDVQGLEIVAFDPRQVKSATGNTGAFNPENPDIRYMPAGGLTLGQPAATTPENEIPSRRPVQRRFLFEPDTGGAAEFRSALIAAAANHPAGKAVTIKDLADYEQAKLFLDEAKTAGLAITPEGDLISVFKAKGSTTDINDILAEAAPEAITLDAYASGKGYLPNLYAKHGFRPVARVEFDRNFAPEAWPYERLGTPDVVLMVNDPTGLSGLPRLDNDYVSKKEEIPLVSYDEALRLQREAVDAVQGKPRAQMMPAEQTGLPLAQETLGEPSVSTVSIRVGDETLDLGEKPTVLEIGSALASRSRKIKRIPYESRTSQAKDAIATALADEIQYAVSQNNSAIGWYEAKIKEAMGLMEKVHPEFATDVDRSSFYKAILAITSNGQDVVSNFERAEKLYRQWKQTGKLDTESSWGGARADGINKGLSVLQKLVDIKGLDGAREFLTTKYRFGDLAKVAKAQFGIKLGSSELANYEAYGSIIFGPKVGGGFFPNLNGDFSPVTMDLWLMRTWNRINGSYGQRDLKGMNKALASLREAARENPDLPDASTILAMNDRQLGNWAEKRFTNWSQKRQFKNPDAFDRPAKRFTESKEGAIESPRKGSERAWVREIFSEVDKKLAERNLPPINNADKQALLWYYEKDLYSKLGYASKRGKPADYADAARRVIQSYGIAD